MIAANISQTEETNLRIKPPLQSNARIAGALYLLLAPFAIFGIAYVPSLIVPGNTAATVNNLSASESLVRLSIISSFFVQVGHIFLVLLLHRLLSPVNRTHALYMVIFILISVPITMVGELNHFAALLILKGANAASAFTESQLHEFIPFFLDLRNHCIFIAHIFWGLWLFPMGYLVFKSGYIPKIFGILLLIGGVGYLVDFLTFVLVPEFGEISSITGLGELIFPLWLLIKGVNVEK